MILELDSSMASVQRVFELSLAPLHLLLHGVEPLLVLCLHLLRLLSGPDLHLQLLPLLLLGELHLVLGLLGLPEHILGLVHCLLGSAYHDGLIFSEDGAAY